MALPLSLTVISTSRHWHKIYKGWTLKVAHFAEYNKDNQGFQFCGWMNRVYDDNEIDWNDIIVKNDNFWHILWKFAFYLSLEKK